MTLYLNMMRFSVLECMDRGDMTLQKIAEKVDVSYTSINIIKSDFEQEGVIKISRPNNQRRVLIELTPKGKDLIKKLQVFHILKRDMDVMI